MSLPAIRAVAERYPNAEIAVLARPWVADLYARETAVSRIIPYTPRGGHHDLARKWMAARSLKAERFDCAILFQNAFEAAAIARLAGIRRIIGYKRDGRGLLLSDAIPVPKPGEIPRHERFYYLALLHRSGLLDTMPAGEPIRLENTAQAAEAGRALLMQRGIQGPVIGVSPGAAYGSAKRWLPERFAEAASQLGGTIAVFGSSAERALCDRVAQLIGPKAHNFAGQTTLREFIDLTAACRLFLTNDSGAMHIASAVAVPTVTVFGSTDDSTTGPTGDLARVVREPVECSPCLLRECPIDHRCMMRVPTSRVVEVARELLGTAVF
ncbi:MAG: lipopolysaccharide heptosyltransferase [Bryobacterales bacterium]|nr:lipopolysaccharide heptosyltransferase [Bryobacterales bacterium]